MPTISASVAFMPAPGGAEAEVLLLAGSLRAFGGRLAGLPAQCLVPTTGAGLSPAARRQLAALQVEVVPFALEPRAAAFPLAAKVYAAAVAEAGAQAHTRLLIWLDADTLILREPDEWRLPAGQRLGACPVMLQNISSLYDQPLNPFWERIYQGCGAPTEPAPPMTTQIDEVRIRPQYNAGLLVVEAARGLLQAWRDNFDRLYCHPDLEALYPQHRLYRVFAHQAILAGTILARLTPAEIQLFSARLNYPVFLHTRYPAARRPQAWADLITARYDAFEFFQAPAWQTLLPLHPPLAHWLEAQLQSVGRQP